MSGNGGKRSIQIVSTRDTGIIDMKTKETIYEKGLPVVCQKLRFYREKIGMEQKELGRRIGVIGNTITNWEHGRGKPDITLIPTICDILGITVYQLLGIDTPNNTYSEREVNLLEKYRRLSDGHKFTVDSLVSSLEAVEAAENCPEITELIYFEKTLAAGIGDPCEFEDKGTPLFLYSSPLIEQADCVFAVNGDSMEPKYHSEDMVLVQRFPKCSELEYGEIGAFIIGNEAYIKVYEKDGLHSLNSKYKSMHFNDEDNVYLIGKVIGIVNPEKDIAHNDDIEKYFSIHEKKSDKRW